MRISSLALGLLFLLPSVVPSNPLHAQAAENGLLVNSTQNLATVGVVEDVILNPWGVSFPARIDTGADLSSLDARGLVVHNDVADFKLGRRFGNLQLQLPVVEWRRIQTAMGEERRPVVKVSVCLGSKRFLTLVTLKDRSKMLYPFLVGRSTLSGKFLVDPSRSRTAQPECSTPSLASSRLLPFVDE